MRSAFHNLGLSPRSWPFLILKAKSLVDGKTYFFVEKTLSFGAAVSCKIFQEFSDSIAHIVAWALCKNLGIITKDNLHRKRPINYLDDYLFVSLLKAVCNQDMEMFLEICRDINFPVSKEKMFFADTVMVFLGLLIDTVRQIVAIPAEKISKAVNMINHVLGKTNRKMTILQLQWICETLNFISHVVVLGQAFTRRLYSGINHKLKQHHHIRITGEMKADLQTWLLFLQHPTVFARPFLDFDLHDAVQLDFYSDASKNPNLGFGAKFGSAYICQGWDPNSIIDKNPSIQYLELYALTATVLAWIHKFKNLRVQVFIDNQGAMKALNKTSSGCKNCMVLIRILVIQQMINCSLCKN